MRRRQALAIYALSVLLLVAMVWIPPRLRSDVSTLAFVAAATAIACGALSLRLLRPMLREAHDPAPAAALLASATLAATIPLLQLAASPTVGIALTPPRLAATLGGILGFGLALPPLLRAWREVEIDEWRPLALAALAMGVTLAPGGDMWFPLLGVALVQAWAFVRCVGLAAKRNALVGLASG